MKCLALVISLVTFGVASARAQDTSTTVSTGSYSASGEEGWLGMGISCSQCTLYDWSRAASRGFTVSSGISRRWTFREAPVVFTVEANGPADRAGLRSGDTLVSIDNHPLTSSEGGERFANVQPRQTVTLHYRRDGHEAEARVTAGARPRSAEFAYQDSLRALARAQARQHEQLEREMGRAREAQQRAMEQSQQALERQREYMERAMRQLQQIDGRYPDSTRQAAVRRTQEMLDSAVARWRVAESLYAQVPAPVAQVPPVWPTPPVAAVAPTPPAVAWALPAPVAPLTYREHRAFGPLRFTGQLGDVVIEARSPYAAIATAESDSEVVVTSRDLSVRIAIRPRQPAPTPRAAPAPKAVPQPRPARTPKPEREPI